MKGMEIMTKEMNISEARKNLMEIPEMLEGGNAPEAIEVTRRGVPVLIMISPEEYMSLAETKEIISDRAALRSIARGVKDANEDRLHTAEEVRKKLGL